MMIVTEYAYSRISIHHRRDSLSIAPLSSKSRRRNTFPLLEQLNKIAIIAITHICSNILDRELCVAEKFFCVLKPDCIQVGVGRAVDCLGKQSVEIAFA